MASLGAGRRRQRNGAEHGSVSGYDELYAIKGCSTCRCMMLRPAEHRTLFYSALLISRKSIL